MAQHSLQQPNVWGQGLLSTFSAMADRLFGSTPRQPQIQIPSPSVSAYLSRKRELPNKFTSQDWQRALEYWDNRCAVCERPRGLWHTLAADHWIPLTHEDCPGTVPINMLPLCHGADGCNNSKGKQMPYVWLVKKLGKRRAGQKLAEIQTYFNWIEQLTGPRLGCPHCGGHIHYEDKWRVWACDECEAFWYHRDTRHYENCPKCQCWMAGDDSFVCPRCNLMWDHENLPTHEKCPTCQRGWLKWVYRFGEPLGWWQCSHCHADWTFD